MFHQVKVQRADMDSLRFLFNGRNGSKCKIRYISNGILIFGVTDSLFCVNYALRSRDKFSEFNPATAEKNLKPFYADNLLKSVVQEKKLSISRKNSSEQCRKELFDFKSYQTMKKFMKYHGQ